MCLRSTGMGTLSFFLFLMVLIFKGHGSKDFLIHVDRSKHGDGDILMVLSCDPMIHPRKLRLAKKESLEEYCSRKLRRPRLSLGH